MASVELSPLPLPVTPHGPEAATPAREPWHRRHRVPLIATGSVLPLYAWWATALASGGGDLAAQEAWAGFVARHPGAVYNLSWHGGLHTGSYSLISPYVMAVFGVVPVTLASGLVSTWLVGRICARCGVARAQWPTLPAALVAALMLWCQAASGRTTFLLGVAFGLAAVLALVSGRRGAVVAGWALAAAMASPVAGLFLAIVGTACLLTSRRTAAATTTAAAGAALLVPPVAVLGLTAWLFPFHGLQPMGLVRIWPPLLMAVCVALAVPRSWLLPRSAAAVYAVAVGLAYLVPSPVGTNVERLAHLAAPPVLLAAAMAGHVHANAAGGPLRWLARARRTSLVLGLVLAVTWVGGNTAAHVMDTAKVPRWAAETDGVVHALERLGAGRSRVEVTMARSHREAVVLAPYVTLARGWNRQADVARGPLFYDGYDGAGVPEGTFTADAYRAWLDHWAVGFVVLHDGPLDAASEREHALVTSGPAYLEPVWRDEHWRIYRVKDPVALVDPPASVVRSDAAEVVVRMPGPGTVTLRVAYSPWLRAEGGGSGEGECLAPARGGLTRLTVTRPGEVTIGSAYGLGAHRCAD
ncbi:hypothetical protein ABT237_20610 [Streptomyces sp. NPDC001581]|uniref:hypothetical protein n=1 Tax=Streptomyces sp. NPDC001581 TaxID=3154386 RepID=UPI00331D8B4B